MRYGRRHAPRPPWTGLRPITPPPTPLEAPHHPTLSLSTLSSPVHRKEGVHAAATAAVEVDHGRDATPPNSLPSGPYSIPPGHRTHPPLFPFDLCPDATAGARRSPLPWPWKSDASPSPLHAVPASTTRTTSFLEPPRPFYIISASSRAP